MKPVEKLVALFRKFPGVGPKQAERFAMHVVRAQKAEINILCEAMTEAKERIKYCSRCRNLSDGDICGVCRDEGRDRSVICVVENAQDVAAVEKTKIFNGVYHVLHGLVSPLSGNNFSSLKIKELVERINESGGGVKEVIIATNPSSDGEATAIYVARLLKNKVPKITRIAYGVPLGGDIDYIDEFTLACALKGRTAI